MTSKRFSSYLADTTQSQHLHHHLRFKVYCERKRYESGTLIERLPQERDEYDHCSARFVVKDLQLDSWVGTARLVPNDHGVLPAERLGAFDEIFKRKIASQRTAEVSRLGAVSGYRSTDCTAQFLQSVILSALAHSKNSGIEWLVFLVTAGLARMLEKIGVPMEPCGPDLEHRGTRRAYRSHVASGIGLQPWTLDLLAGDPGYRLFSQLPGRQEALPAASCVAALRNSGAVATPSAAAHDLGLSPGPRRQDVRREHVLPARSRQPESVDAGHGIPQWALWLESESQSAEAA